MLGDTIWQTIAFTGSDIVWTCLMLIISIRAGIVGYRLLFHPLRHVPGPRLAAATNLYLRYYEVVEHGGLTKSLPSLHEFYNSDVIRIAPNHVHINEPSVYRKVYGSKPVFRKCGRFFGSAQGVHTIVTADDPHRHRAMRNSASPLFSPREMGHCFDKGRKHVQLAAESMARKGQEGEPVDLHGYFQAVMTNIVADTVLDCPRQLVSYDAPTSGWMAVHHFISRYRWLIGDLPWLVPIGLRLLEIFPGWISAISDGFKDLYEHCKKVGNEILIARKGNHQALTVLLLEHHGIQDLTDSDASALLQQAAVFLLAGTSPAITLTVACFHILQSTHVKEQLRKELDELDSRTPAGICAPEFDWRELTRLRYLDAVIKESLRIIPPIPGLLPRVVPSHGMQAGSHFIPGGTRISAAHFAFHHNGTTFPNPNHFDPERWLHKSPEDLQAMEQYFMPFSKGSRACIGWQHAYVYMFTTIAYMLTRFEMEAEKLPDTLHWKDQTGAVPVAPPLVWVRPRKRT